MLVARIKARAAEGAPLFDPNARQEDLLLFEWWRAEGRDTVQAHIVAVFARDTRQVGNFLHANAPQAWRDGAAVPHISDLGAGELKRMKALIDLDVLANWIQKSCPGDFENPSFYHDDTMPPEQCLAEQFMFVYNKWKKDGEPPDRHAVMESSQPESEAAGEEAADGMEEQTSAA